MSRVSNLASGLYRGEVSFDFVGRRKLWYSISAVLLFVSLGALAVNGLKFGVEFEGGSVFAVPTETCTVEVARDATTEVVGTEIVPIVTELNSSNGRSIHVQTDALTPKETTEVTHSLADACNVPATTVSAQVIGPSWGEQITKKAFTGLGVFLIAIVIYLSIMFEWRMAVGALVALFHDVFITVGIYALVGFEVTPASVVGILTILGYSLYDTVVVFDKVKENTRGLLGLTRRTYAEAANLALNQTLMRSINTSLIAVLPVVGLMVVGVGLLGVGTLADLALVQMVGILAG
ncbi:MAG TPA: protein translocase subunit SecF, partial [Actinomycetes bacterium]|nr:protein translocase subunit SecF [Actinomycetes bacterium]